MNTTMTRKVLPTEIDILTVTPEVDGFHVGITRKYIGRRLRPYHFFGRSFSSIDIELALAFLAAEGFEPA